MDALLDVVRALRFTGGVFLDAEFTEPWAVRSQVDRDDCRPFGQQPRHLVAYHYVVEGALTLEAEGHAAVRLSAGSVVMLPRNDAHVMSSAPGVPPVDAAPLIRPGRPDGLPRLVHGGGGLRTHILCGFLGTEVPEHALFGLLPGVLTLDVGQGARAKWIEGSLRFAAEELGSGRVGSLPMLGRLAELLFVEAVRRSTEEAPPMVGWLAGLRDPVVGRALAVMHAHPSHPWTASELAREAGASRSAFAQRFRALVGEPPMRYLAGWRLQRAAARLRESDDAVGQIGLEAGYDSEAAFSRAFRRAYGSPPAAWRRHAHHG
jgi:AraC-like DNA-binding protein